MAEIWLLHNVMIGHAKNWIDWQGLGLLDGLISGLEILNYAIGWLGSFGIGLIVKLLVRDLYFVDQLISYIARIDSFLVFFVGALSWIQIIELITINQDYLCIDCGHVSMQNSSTYLNIRIIWIKLITNEVYLCILLGPWFKHLIVDHFS